jgi:hypothetical protein
MKLYAQLPLVCVAILASLPAVLLAAGSADAPQRAACREQALAEGLRSEEVILDFVHECLDSIGSADHRDASASSVSPDSADPPRSAAHAPGPRPAARLD